MADGPRGRFLGMNREGGVPTVWRASVEPGDVLGYFDDRREREVVVDAVGLRDIVRCWSWTA
jgi:hypothetical protein